MNETTQPRPDPREPLAPAISPRAPASVGGDWNELAPPFSRSSGGKTASKAAGQTAPDAADPEVAAAEGGAASEVAPGGEGAAGDGEAVEEITAYAPDESAEPDPWELPPVEAEISRPEEAESGEEEPWAMGWDDETDGVAGPPEEAVAETPAPETPAAAAALPAEEVLREAADRVARVAERFRSLQPGDLSVLEKEDPLALLIAGYLIGHQQAQAADTA